MENEAPQQGKQPIHQKQMESTEETPPTKKTKTEKSQDHFKKLVLNGDYVDKTRFIEELEKVNLAKNCIVSFRPRRFGKSLTLSMLKNYYDVKTGDENTFQSLYIGKNPTKRAHRYLVLTLNFSGIDTTSFKEFEVSLNNKLNNKMKKFQEYYQEELKEHPFQINENDCVSTYERLVSSVSLSGETLYVLVDEYDASVNEALGNVELAKDLRYDPKEAQQKTKKIESKFKQILSTLKDSSQNEGVYVFVTGVTPLALTEFTSGFNDARDITLEREFAEMYGFTEEEVKSQLNFIPKELNLVDDIVEMLRERHNGYRFASITYFSIRKDDLTVIDVPSIYNPERIRFNIGAIQRNFQLLSAKYTLQELQSGDKNLILNGLFHFTEDPNTKPAESTLQLLINNVLFLNSAKELMEKQRIQCKFVPRFTLSSIVGKLIKESNSLLSFLYFQGALTHSKESEGYLVIPNTIAKSEFLEQCLGMISWEQSDLDEVKAQIIRLFEKNEIKGLCEVVDQLCFSTLKESQVFNHKEDGLSQAFFDAFRFSFLSFDITQEYIVNRGLKYKYAIDMALVTQNKRIFVEFKNITAGMLSVDLNGKKIVYNDGNWEFYQDLSNKLLEEQDNKRILKLSLQSNYHQKYGKSVDEYLTRSIQKVEKEYIPELQRDTSKSVRIVVFVVLRVGLRRMLIHRFGDLNGLK